VLSQDILWRVPFDRFVVDFYCHSSKLVVELDGKQHEWFADYDAERTKVLESRGVRVIRFANARSRAISISSWRGFARRCGCPSTEGAVPSPPAHLPNFSRMGEGGAVASEAWSRKRAGR
jgi:hypothetical protein